MPMITRDELDKRFVEYEHAVDMLHKADLLHPMRDVLCAYGNLAVFSLSTGLINAREYRTLKDNIQEMERDGVCTQSKRLG